MKILLNTTKTMELVAPAPGGIRPTRPVFQAEAAGLAQALRRLEPHDLAAIMDLSPQLTDATRADLALWGAAGRPARPALFAFTGLVFKLLEARSLTREERRDAQARLRILSGLYGYLRPHDLIEAYRLEMGCRFTPPGARNLTHFWRERLTAALNADLDQGEPILNLASAEYAKVLDRSRLRGPLISPAFKQRRPDGTLKVVTVHAKQARGLMARFCLQNGCEEPADLLEFAADGWEAAGDPPAQGEWVFRR